MNYQLLFILLFYFFPEKLCWNIRMDIRTVSFSLNKSIETMLCNNELRPREISSDKNLTAFVCYKYKNNSIISSEINCANSSFTIAKRDCIKTLVHEFDKLLKRLSTMKLSSEAFSEIRISLGISDIYGMSFNSKFTPIEQITAGPVQNFLTITLNGRQRFNVTLVYSFKCKENYYGADCQEFCKPIDKESGHYNCTETGQRICLKGWKGFFCSEANCDQCINGQCVGPGKCSCYRGWTGSNCEICQKAPGCMQGMCQNDTGVSNSSKPQLKAFTCSCHPGWGGQNCDIDLKHCISHAGLCKNNGVCHNYYGDHIKHYLCQCAPGFYGRHCEIQTGDCKHDKFSQKNYLTKHQTPTCRCYPGFSGSYCQINDTLQFQIDSIKSYKSDGYCVNSKEGYSCSCSDLYGGLCKCRFIKCLDKGKCIDIDTPDIKCSNIDKPNTTFQFLSNFKFENSSLIIRFDQTKPNRHEVTPTFDIKYYIISLIFVTLMFGILVVIAVKFRYKFRRKSRASIKTIHNDLGIANNQIKNPILFTEQNFLLNQKSLSISFSSGNCKRNFISVVEPLDIEKKSGDEFKSKSIEEETIRSDLLNPIDGNSVVKPVHNPKTSNPNLLINNYKNIDGNNK